MCASSRPGNTASTRPPRRSCGGVAGGRRRAARCRPATHPAPPLSHRSPPPRERPPVSRPAPGAAAWVRRRTDVSRLSGGPADQLPARGELGWQVQQLVARGRMAAVRGFATRAIRAGDGGLLIEGDSAEGRREIGPVDRIVVATGQRPDPAMTRELRLELDPWLEWTRALAPLIDPNLHSSG